ncbi:MAG: sialate O-acetylesterase [Clostridiales Family XIII bacterium]|nr:sialate O-acetylesterase [Clostridiales Family XIII bacterium]
MIKLARIFQDRMVLQREKPTRIWGESGSAQKLSVLLNGVPLIEGAEVDGHFSLILPPQAAMTDAVLSLRGSTEEDELEFKEVDFGEVWIAGGQSNMEFPLEFDSDAAAQIAGANDRHLRFYDVGEYAFDGEEEEGFKNSKNWDGWLCFEPDSARFFSAVGLYFAKRLREELDVPFAIVGCNWGGTTASAWLDESFLEEDPGLRIYLDTYRENADGLDLIKYRKQSAGVRRLLSSPAGERLSEHIWQGHPTFGDIVMAVPFIGKHALYMAASGPESPNRPAGLYHNMVEKIAGYTCRGVIWYQGESDENLASLYGKLFSAVISCWRGAWEDSLPFLFVQIAPFGNMLFETGGDRFPDIREQQEWVSKNVPGAYMASIMDAGMKKDIHPKDKRTPGERLALLALGKVYGRDILCEPPEAISAERRADPTHIEIKFANAGEGLFLKGDPLRGLALFDGSGREVKRWTAKAEGASVRVYTDGPVAEIRYGWTGYVDANLYNSAGLCAKPFRMQVV